MIFRILLTIISFCLIAPGYAQQTTEQPTPSKKERKEARKAKQEAEMLAMEELLASREWIIEANMLFGRRGQTHILDPSINFVGVNGDDAAIQFGFNHLIGWNGVGGITLEGKETSFEMKKRKAGKPAMASMRFMGRGAGSANITITVTSAGQARADVYGDFGERFSFSGRIVPIEESRVYQGQALF